MSGLAGVVVVVQHGKLLSGQKLRTVHHKATAIFIVAVDGGG